jgi:glycerate kinase
MRILVAPDKFKGSLSAVAAAEAIARGWRSVDPQAEITLAPIADGGEGFAEALCLAMGGKWITRRVQDPLGREVEGRFAWIESTKTAVLEMSEASGLWRLKSDELAPLRANTFGTGQLMREAVELGATRILIGLGGSATTDGGIGMAAALGYIFYTSDGEPLQPVPENLLALTRIGIREAISLPEIVAACDVQNPLLGERGTARVFSPQKGADPSMVERLEQSMENLADVVTLDLGCDHRTAAGAGAAGGIGFGLLSFCGARMQSGFDLVADVLGLEQRVREADLVITGEGRLDAQSLEGKGPVGVAQLARIYGKPILGLAGSVIESAPLSEIFTAVRGVVDQPVTLEVAMERGAEFLERAARQCAQLVVLGRRFEANGDGTTRLVSSKDARASAPRA